MSRRRIHVESWDPEYDSPLGQLSPDESSASIDPQVELPPDRWRPLSPPPATLPARNLLFIDGVRRIDALVWIEDGQGAPMRRGLCASYAAGVLRAAEATLLADRCAATLPAYASVPHKDPRAPQNLFPIGGLERELRHRLGDAALVQRALRIAAACPKRGRLL